MRCFRGWRGGKLHVAGLALFVSGCLLNPQPDDPANQDDKKNATNGESPAGNPDQDSASQGGSGANIGFESPPLGSGGVVAVVTGAVPGGAVAGAASGAVGGCAFLGLAGGGAVVIGGGPNCGIAGMSQRTL